MRLWGICHHHEYGDSIYAVASEQEPTEDQCIEVLEAEYEPDKGESLTVDEITSIRRIPVKDMTIKVADTGAFIIQ